VIRRNRSSRVTFLASLLLRFVCLYALVKLRPVLFPTPAAAHKPASLACAHPPIRSSHASVNPCLTQKQPGSSPRLSRFSRYEIRCCYVMSLWSLLFRSLKLDSPCPFSQPYFIHLSVACPVLNTRLVRWKICVALYVYTAFSRFYILTRVRLWLL
jgi:hypothetical protein